MIIKPGIDIVGTDDELPQWALDAAAGARWGTPDHPVTPYAHQVRQLAELWSAPSWGLFAEQGCGKSAPTAVRIRDGFASGDLNGPVLILCPLSVVSVWTGSDGELMRHAGVGSIAVVGDAKQRSNALKQLDFVNGIGGRNGGPAICVTNYETLIGRTFAELAKIRWSAVVCDEAHRIAGVRTRTHRALMKLSWYSLKDHLPRILHRWALTGTPARNGPTSIFGIGVFLRGTQAFGTFSKTAFESRYAVFGGFENREIVAYRNVPELNAKVRRFSSRILKEDCLDLPERIVTVRRVPLAGEQARVYKDMRTHAVARLQTIKNETGTVTASNVLVERLRLLQIAGGWVHCDKEVIRENTLKFTYVDMATGNEDGMDADLVPNAKLDLLTEILADCPKPVVVWSPFVHGVKMICRALGLADPQLTIAEFIGDTPQKHRERIIAEFQAGKIDVIVATPQAGGTGITLTAAATEIFYCKTDDAVSHWQAMERVHRIGQEKHVLQIHLLAQGTVDVKVHAALEEKRTLQEQTVGAGTVEDML